MGQNATVYLKGVQSDGGVDMISQRPFVVRPYGLCHLCKGSGKLLPTAGGPTTESVTCECVRNQIRHLLNNNEIDATTPIIVEPN